ncbi:MAG TPA: chemotaxis protein CheB [Isosphaeraceae bacterium]|jgi:two-component system chemotaxis response regulator CheB
MDKTTPHIPPFPVVAVASSAGGLQALKGLVAALPADFPAAVVLVQHLDPRHPSHMAEILARHTTLAVRQAQQGDRLRPGAIFIAPPGRHLLVGGGDLLELTQTARVHLVRPSADALFESIAREYGPRAIAVVLTGSGSDGSGGVRAIKGAGGIVIAQDRATSEHYSMPGAAVATGCVDHVLPLGEIVPRLVALLSPGVAS